jgi:hypothetical protein
MPKRPNSRPMPDFGEPVNEILSTSGSVASAVPTSSPGPYDRHAGDPRDGVYQVTLAALAATRSPERCGRVCHPDAAPAEIYREEPALGHLPDDFAPLFES